MIGDKGKIECKECKSKRIANGARISFKIELGILLERDRWRTY
jgi:hypothetical protein